jgi:hypothetical protein
MIVADAVVGPMIAASIRRMAIGFAEAHRRRRLPPRLGHVDYVMAALRQAVPCSQFEMQRMPADRVTAFVARCMAAKDRSISVSDLALHDEPRAVVEHLARRLACPVCEAQP